MKFDTPSSALHALDPVIWRHVSSQRDWHIEVWLHGKVKSWRSSLLSWSVDTLIFACIDAFDNSYEGVKELAEFVYVVQNVGIMSRRKMYGLQIWLMKGGWDI